MRVRACARSVYGERLREKVEIIERSNVIYRPINCKQGDRIYCIGYE